MNKIVEYLLALPLLIIYLVVSVVMVTKLVVEKKTENWDEWKWQEVCFIICFLFFIAILFLLRGNIF